MKKKVLSLLLALTMTAGLLAGCGSSGTETKETETETTENDAETAETETSDAETAEEGKVLNIYCWNEEFKTRVTDH